MKKSVTAWYLRYLTRKYALETILRLQIGMQLTLASTPHGVIPSAILTKGSDRWRTPTESGKLDLISGNLCRVYGGRRETGDGELGR